MAKITTEQAMKITSSTSSGYFSLKDDNDSANVKFMYNSADEIETYAVHEVEVNGFNRHVDCLKDAEGNGVCPFCEKGVKRTARTFFKLYNADKDTVEVWDCGIKRAPMIESIIRGRSEHIVNDCYEIVRHGKARATDTTYEVRWKGKDEYMLEDLPKAPEIYGRYVLKKTAAEMEHFITHNEFPKTENASSTTEKSAQQTTKRVNRMAF